MLRCRSDKSQSSMKWGRGITVTQIIASSSRGVYDGIDGYPRRSLNISTEGQFDLIINSTHRNDTNTYSCSAGHSFADSAELVLLGKLY